MKNTQPTPRPHISKSIASHAFVGAIFTTPWLIFAYNDLFTILTSKEGTAVQGDFASNLHVSMSVLSFALLFVAIVSFGYYLVKKSK